MRYDGEHKAATRLRIVKSAAQQIRRDGPNGIGVAAIMADVGLTHGGFYAHFRSKDALVAEAVDAMFVDAHRRGGALDDALADDATDLPAVFRGYLASYLSPEHRDRPERGCPLPALSSHMSHLPEPARAGFARGFDRLATRIEAVMARLGKADPRAEAHAILAAMVGGVAMARAVGPGAASDAMLHDTLATLTARLGI